MDLRNFGRPLLLGNRSADYPFSSSATGVVCQIGSDKVVVTAKHVVFPGDTDSSERLERLTTILDIDGPQGELVHFSDFFPMTISHRGVEQVCSDLIALKIQRDQADRVRHSIPMFQDGDWIGIRLPRAGRRIVTYGYLNWPEAPTIDVEARVLNARPVQVFASMTAWESGNTIGVARITQINDRDGNRISPPLDGLSGAPVYYTKEQRSSYIGTTLMAGNGIMRFVASTVIREAMRNMSVEPEVY